MKGTGASSGRGETRRRRREERAVSLNGTPSQGRADLHIHTTFSDGWPGPVEVVRRARRLGLHVIAITDHDTIEGALWAADYAGRLGAGAQVIVGEEVSTRNGHVVGLFLEKRVRPGQSAA